ncbi:ras, putative [Entamoeba invadens IP1]|uniref:Ras, putative n=1 Tax=Entamoeba invadens IP1 TaxID=370355 RepID=A0A0A1TZX9_ENTIV|nr:ras, putative [Entamoeba invadens IP1]ELP85771.1 ras, putative [Entamoeba invadens IP1]|eukprot:XP_004185117.1 ras, putative [Entamoeba invadens IP1]
MGDDYKVELVKVILLGDGGVGKSVLTIQFTSNMFVEEYDPTVENCYRKTVNVDGKVCVLDILDTAGREEYQTMIDPYIRQSQCFMIIYSINNKETFACAQKYYARVSRIKENDAFDQCILIGNKTDLADARQVPTSDGQAFAKSKGISFIETSAKKRTNVDEAFYEVVRISRKTAQVQTEEKKKKKACYIL